jgi:hypothetical protein
VGDRVGTSDVDDAAKAERILQIERQRSAAGLATAGRNHGMATRFEGCA